MKRTILRAPLSLLLVVSLLSLYLVIVGGVSGNGPSVTLISNDPSLTNPRGITTDGVNLYVYDYTSPRILSVPIAGGPPTVIYPGVTGSVLGLTLAGANLYWIDPNSGPFTDTQILKAPKDGSGPIVAIFTSSAAGNNLEDGSGLTTDGVKLYGADEIQGRVYSLNLDGGGITQLDGNRYSGWFDTEHRNDVDESEGILYVADQGKAGVIQPQVVSIPKTGGVFTPLHSGSPFVGPVAIAVGNGMVYVSDPGAGNTIWQLPISGGAPSVLVSGSPFVELSHNGLLFYNNALYVTDYGNVGPTDGPGAIYRVDLAPEPTPTPTPTATPVPPTPTLVPGVGWPGLLVLAFGLASLALLFTTRRASSKVG